jgi:hypothetical protein
MSKPSESIAAIRDGSDENSIRFLFGEHARHVPMWMYVQNQGQGMVSFVGASKSDELRYGSEREHQFILGELVVRPHLVIATDTLRGMGLSGLATGNHDLRAMLADGEITVSQASVLRQLREKGELP